MAQKPGIPKGTRDFSPLEMVRRNYIFDTIKAVFKQYGYQPIETPSMENLSTLLGKYGIEGDKLLFKVLNSGDFAGKIPEPALKTARSTDILPYIAEKGLRYDLTVPFARYVVQHRNEITFPFKRYQIQPVWRADRPQKGRYREFFQCDVDVIGSDSLLNEAELVLIINDVFKKLKVKNTIKINNRKVLFGIAETVGEPDNFMAITVAIDKLDKIGLEGVEKELLNSGISKDAIRKINDILAFTGSSADKIAYLGQLLKDSAQGMLGIQEISEVFQFVQAYTLDSQLTFDMTLARGLNYYTGAIFEVLSQDVKIGSICGGGRYDDLTGIFGLPGVSGVGISFGADRVYDVLAETNHFPPETHDTTQVLFVNFGAEESRYCFSMAGQLRKAGISAEVYPDGAKLKKQMTYAHNKQIPFVVLIGDNEMKSKSLTVKNMLDGTQTSYSQLEDFIAQLT